MKKFKDPILLALRLCLGSVFIIAGAAKFTDPLGFATTIARYDVYPEKLLSLMGLGIPRLEILVGLLLVIGLFSRGVALLTSLFCLGFALTVGSALVRGLEIDCGCFSSQSPISWGHVLFDAGLLGVSLVLLKQGPGKWSLDQRVQPDQISSRKLAILLGLSVCLNVSYLFWRSTSTLTSLSLETPLPNHSLIEFTPTQIDFGQVYQGQNLGQIVKYKNISSQTLTIEHIEASCGCTTATPTKRVLEPGESTEMNVGLATETKQGPTRNQVSIYFQGFKEPQSFSVTADVQPIISLNPMLIEPKAGKPVTVTMNAMRPDLDFDVIEIQAPTPGIQAKVIGKPKPGQVLIEVSTQKSIKKPPAPIDTWTLDIRTDLAGLPPFSLYVKP